MAQKIYITNASGEKELFSKNKIFQGARRAGASKILAHKISETIQKDLYDGISTNEIFNYIRKLLHNESPGVAMKFSLKKAIYKLGPSGFSFEKYMGEIFNRWGYQVLLNQTLSGKCVNYEIDFLAEKQNEILVGECKFHNIPGSRVDLKIVLATYARFLDLKNGSFLRNKTQKKLLPKNFLITNNKFTDKAIQYAKCSDIELLGWRYPYSKGLEYYIENENLYPITILDSVSPQLLEQFANHQLILIDNLFNISAEELAKKIGVSVQQIVKLKQQAELLLNKKSGN